VPVPKSGKKNETERRRGIQKETEGEREGVREQVYIERERDQKVRYER